MESQQHQKVVNIAYLAFAGLVAFVLLTMFMKLSDLYDLESKVKAIEFIIRGASLAVGLVVFVGLYKHQKANQFMNEVASELLTKVTWPSRRDTTYATVVVMITVVIAGIILATFDWLWMTILKWVL